MQAFQSLLHQGISLLETDTVVLTVSPRGVSIPSSSGHQFTGPRLGNETRGGNPVSIPSSSGHQFTVGAYSTKTCARSSGFNPFFIRASVYWLENHSALPSTAGYVSIPSSSGHQFTESPRRHPGCRRGRVSIPSSSGHQFTGVRFAKVRLVARSVSIPSSSGHQFTVQRHSGVSWCPVIRFNPFFIRASVYCCAAVKCTVVVGCKWFQSLLHQGISLLAGLFVLKNIACGSVSIPSSSGHQFTEEMQTSPPEIGGFKFQSLLHQGISLLEKCRVVWNAGNKVFQSLLHQGISLLRAAMLST